ncbi:MAG: hypothetical protein WBD20_21530 [Pirellulaceae bacterium]
MKTSVSLYFAIACLFALPASADKPATKTQLKLGQQFFALKFVESDETSGTVNEYIPEGESLDRWTKMIAIRSQPMGNDPGKAVGALVNALQTKNPQAKFAIWKSDDGNRVGVDFITWEGEITEFNVFIYQRGADGNGLTSHQYAERAYGDDMIPFMKGMKERRAALLDQVLKFDFPAIVTKSVEK